jgi:peptide/nickel transport system substrate-binding protein
MKFKYTLLCSAALLAFGLASAQAKSFKWSSASDIPTLDIHSQNNALGNGVHASVYESLVYYNSTTFKVEPTTGHQLAPGVADPDALSRCAPASSSATARR